MRFLIRRATTPNESSAMPRMSPDDPVSGTVTVEAIMRVSEVIMLGPVYRFRFFIQRAKIPRERIPRPRRRPDEPVSGTRGVEASTMLMIEYMGDEPA